MEVTCLDSVVKLDGLPIRIPGVVVTIKVKDYLHLFVSRYVVLFVM